LNEGSWANAYHLAIEEVNDGNMRLEKRVFVGLRVMPKENRFGKSFALMIPKRLIEHSECFGIRSRGIEGKLNGRKLQALEYRQIIYELEQRIQGLLRD
jgi:hypothetical protein